MLWFNFVVCVVVVVVVIVVPVASCLCIVVGVSRVDICFGSILAILVYVGVIEFVIVCNDVANSIVVVVTGVDATTVSLSIVVLPDVYDIVLMFVLMPLVLLMIVMLLLLLSYMLMLLVLLSLFILPLLFSLFATMVLSAHDKHYTPHTPIPRIYIYIYTDIYIYIYIFHFARPKHPEST